MCIEEAMCPGKEEEGTEEGTEGEEAGELNLGMSVRIYNSKRGKCTIGFSSVAVESLHIAHESTKTKYKYLDTQATGY